MQEKARYFAKGMEVLQTDRLQESSGKLIGELMQFKQTRILVFYARKWLADFRDHEYAPKLVGHWLEQYDSNEAMYLAEYYVRTVSKPVVLRSLLRAIGSSKRSPRRIYDLIEARMEREPLNDAWSCLQKFEGKNSRRAEKIILRWMELNRTNKTMDIIVSVVALYSESTEILESALKWAEAVGNSDNYYFVLAHLLRGTTPAHKFLTPRTSAFSRRWIESHHNDPNCGHVLGTLINCVADARDIHAGKEWFKKHERNSSSHSVLIGLLSAYKILNQEPDLYVVKKAKTLLKRQPPDKRTPAMEAALFNVCPDRETVAILKQTCTKTKSVRMIGPLLLVAPNKELIAMAQETIARYPSIDLERDLLTALLRQDPKNPELRKNARRWIRKHGKKVSSTTLMSLQTALATY
ncbi:MAG: hypothetical protein JST89_06210 [Cyanobacteria bacterium SZAS-4]|nr:hypothetical protein [Cyanobacteria bacterium SZAS-4]